MRGRAPRLLKKWSSFFPHRKQSFDQAFVFLMPTHTLQALSHGFGHGGRETFSGQLRQLMGEAIRLFVLNVQAHGSILPSLSTLVEPSTPQVPLVDVPDRAG